MKRFIHFFSLAVMTQVVLMLSQLILLPIQVRVWGQAQTAFWYSALALATISYVVDCGLRTAGHAELLKASSDPINCHREAEKFLQVWSWIRILVLTATSTLVLVDVVVNVFLHSASYPLWRAALILACALESILIIRIMYLDSLGNYRGAEASYFVFALLRLALSIPALVVFHFTAPGLAVIYLITSACALLAQGHWLCKTRPLLQLTCRFPKPDWKALALTRFTLAEPLANWARLSLPVLIIGQIAPPVAVTTYVALRAVFGAGRTTIQQLARVASVEFLKNRERHALRRADSLLTVLVALSVFFGFCVGLFVVLDDLRLLGLWIKHFDRHLFQQIALAFALTAPFFSYQVPISLLFRAGELAFVARRHYLFILCSATFATASLVAKALPYYLVLLVVAEMALSTSFFAPGRVRTVLDETHAGRVGLTAAMSSSLVILVFGIFTYGNLRQVLSSFSFIPMAETSCLFLAATLIMAALLCRFCWTYIQSLRTLKTPEPALAVTK